VQQRVRPVVQRILDQMGTPAIVRNARGDYIAANQLGRALYAPLFESREQPANSARFTFLDPAAIDFFADWDRVASDIVAHLRSEAGRNPYDRGVSDLVGELSTRSDEFRRRWSAHDVRIHGAGIKHFHHSVVGDLTLAFETVELQAERGLDMCICAAEPGSSSAEKLTVLASWAAGMDLGAPDIAADRA
jgi:hypothetical protein